MKLTVGLVIAGKYRLDKRLAAGGMGSIWVARHAQLDVPVAIKFMDSSHANSPVSRQRFEREAKAAASLRSPHVVHVQDYGVSDDVPYIVMELLQGEDLGRRLHRERRISLSQAAKILAQTARGLRRAHEMGIVHRDLKPANIFLARAESSEEEEIVKLLDFGIAKETLAVIVGESTRTGELMGSPHYMSPEQIRVAPDLDARSDLWSLAVVIFRAITGHMPFSGDVLGSIIAQILADPIPAATKVAPDLPVALDPFFARAFARDRSLRYQSAREMAEAFATIVHGAPLMADPPTFLPDAPFPGLGEADGAQAPTGASVPTPGRLTPQRASMPDTPAPASEGQAPSSTMTSTDGPLVSTGGPIQVPAAASPWSPVMVGVAAALFVVGGGIAYFSLRSVPPRPAVAPPESSAYVSEGSPPEQEASGAPSSDDAVPVPPTSASAPAATAAASSARPSATPTSVAVRPSVSPSATPKATASAKVPPAPSASPASSAKKRPSWGF